ncbi:DUF2884 family protein [Bowmanella dokdonensis]|uniref:YggN family protein n=1 Tax=Bowmanella dokdonensis TaxID=751969 RepID=A0A939DNA8_9ALTE|nr:DUF2884 family protein [Bowmanella dokdonensis]MBN7825934.1 YggN family protein [Bowmanella dokdonensis]
MKTFAAATLILASSAMANDCNINLQGEMNLEQGILTLKTDNRTLQLDGRTAYLDSQMLHLNNEQADLLNNYHKEVTLLAPKVADIALEAVGLASEGISRAFGGLLGDDDALVLDLGTEMADLRHQLQQEFYAEDGSIRFSSHHFDEDGIVVNSFENEFEQKIEQAVERSMGRILIAVGKEMLFSGGDMQAFEARMENFGEQIEHEMEAKAAVLERKAEHLCYDLTKIDQLETRINQSIPELEELDMVRVSRSVHSM